MARSSEVTDTTDQSAWNLSAHDTMLMGNFWRISAGQFARGDVRSAFFTVIEIKYLIYTDLKKHERETLQTIEKKSNKVYGLLTKYQRMVEDYEDDDEMDINKILKRIRRLKEIYANLFSRYRTYIRVYMGEYGYLIAKKEDDSNIV